MKRISKNVLKISLLIGMLVCLLGTATNVNATAVSNTTVGASGEIVSNLATSFFKILNVVVPKAFDATKTIAKLLIEKGGDLLQDKIGEVEAPEEKPKEDTIEEPEEKPVEKNKFILDTDIMYGDIDGNGKIEAKDYDLLVNYVYYNALKEDKETTAEELKKDFIEANLIKEESELKTEETLTKEQLIKSDVFLDEEVDILDLIQLRYYLIEKGQLEKIEDEEVEKVTELPKIIYGNINDDWNANDEDIEVLEKYLNKEIELTDIQLIKANLNLDNAVDKEDLEILKKYVNKEIDTPLVPKVEEEKEQEESEKDAEEEPEEVINISDGLGKVINIFKGSDLLNVFKSTLSTITSIFLK